MQSWKSRAALSAGVKPSFFPEVDNVPRIPKTISKRSVPYKSAGMYNKATILSTLTTCMLYCERPIAQHSIFFYTHPRATF